MKQATKRRKRVLYLITKATYGGAQRYVFDLARNLPKEVYEPVVAYGTHGKLAEDLSASGIRTYQLPSLARDIALISDIRSFFAILRCIREIRADAVHVNSSKAAALGVLAARIAGVSTILFTVHGWPFKEDRSDIAKALIYFVSWITGLLSHQVIVISKKDEALARRMWWVRHKVVYIPLGIERPKFLSPTEGFTKVFGTQTPPRLEASTRRLVTIAELTPNKGIQYAIAAIAELTRRGADCIYVIVGDGEERDSLKKLASDLGVDDRIYFTGFLPEAARYLPGFDVFILPSVKEGAPYVLLEAGVAGLSIVATTAVDSELKDQFRHVRIVPPQDTEALAEAIAELATLPRATEQSESSPLSKMVEKTEPLYY